MRRRYRTLTGGSEPELAWVRGVRSALLGELPSAPSPVRSAMPNSNEGDAQPLLIEYFEFNDELEMT